MLVEKSNGQWIVVLDRGQNLMATLTEIVAEKKIQGGHISAIGALEDVEIGAYLRGKKDYVRKTFSGEDFELVSLNGNVSLKDGAPYVHAHSVLGREDFSLFGGHLFEAKVAVTAEIYITPFGVMPERQLNEELGLATIQNCPL